MEQIQLNPVELQMKLGLFTEQVSQLVILVNVLVGPESAGQYPFHLKNHKLAPRQSVPVRTEYRHDLNGRELLFVDIHVVARPDAQTLNVVLFRGVVCEDGVGVLVSEFVRSRLPLRSSLVAGWQGLVVAGMDKMQQSMTYRLVDVG
jgi:hypothetical protein